MGEEIEKPEFMTVEEAAQILRVNTMTVRRLLGKQLEFYQFGKLVRIRREDFERFLAESRRGIKE